jgi:hypothetical protein
VPGRRDLLREVVVAAPGGDHPNRRNHDNDPDLCERTFTPIYGSASRPFSNARRREFGGPPTSVPVCDRKQAGAIGRIHRLARRADRAARRRADRRYRRFDPRRAQTAPTDQACKTRPDSTPMEVIMRCPHAAATSHTSPVPEWSVWRPG